jgi:hypothetical protein
MNCIVSHIVKAKCWKFSLATHLLKCMSKVRWRKWSSRRCGEDQSLLIPFITFCEAYLTLPLLMEQEPFEK